MNQKQKLQEQIAKLRAEYHSIDEREKRQANLKFVGKYFKFKNCYSCPEGEKDYWTGYTKVLKLDGIGLRCTQFEIDQSGKAWMTSNMFRMDVGTENQITKREYDKAVAKFKAHIEKCL
jgi:hypothetical protein